jgi:predicted dithiol-disulfide oxidoreductase (DUF899 family)
MPSHQVGTREQWRQARLELLAAEKELTRRNDELTLQRQQLPWVRMETDYLFSAAGGGGVSLPDLFGHRSQLLIYHFMFGPDWEAGCPMCSSLADGFDGIRVHLEHHDVALAAVSLAPADKLAAYRKRMGWSFPWVSSSGTSFNVDFGVSYTAESVAGGAEHNFAPLPAALLEPRHLPAEAQGLSAFALEDGVVYHTYSAYARGCEPLWGMWQWLDRAPGGRNEQDMSWFHRHDEYSQPAAG